MIGALIYRYLSIILYMRIGYMLGTLRNALKVYYNIIKCYPNCRRACHYLFTRYGGIYTLNTCFLTFPMLRSTTRYVSTETNPHISFIV